MKKLIVLLIVVFVIVACASKVTSADGEYFDVIAQQDIEYGGHFRAIIVKVTDKSNGVFCYLELTRGGIDCFKDE